jgi:hypothetical protein
LLLVIYLKYLLSLELLLSHLLQGFLLNLHHQLSLLHPQVLLLAEELVITRRKSAQPLRKRWAFSCNGAWLEIIGVRAVALDCSSLLGFTFCAETSEGEFTTLFRFIVLLVPSNPWSKTGGPVAIPFLWVFPRCGRQRCA